MMMLRRMFVFSRSLDEIGLCSFAMAARGRGDVEFVVFRTNPDLYMFAQLSNLVNVCNFFLFVRNFFDFLLDFVDRSSRN